ncbi:TPA: VWA domain-containing protein, partial [Candidatus Poribacteria bacterium]|nr:VWA domain-containing protein [Candidatus Poribacteria bacterium]
MGLSFLSPLFLIGLAGASIPIIIHLLNRERARRVLFSSLRFIKNAHQANVKRHKLKQLILLLMRTLMLAILALAFARPFFAQDPQIAEKGGRRNVVIILDNSYSMGYSDNFSRAKSEAMNVISDLNPQDTAALIFNSDTALVVKELSSEHDEIKMALNAHAKLTYNPTNYVNAIQAADEVLKFANIGEKVVYLISDLQKVGFQNFIETDRLSPGVDVNVSADLRVENPVNLAVTGISAPEIALNEKKPARIVARIANFSGKSLADVPVKLIIDGVQMGEQKVDILANDTADAIFDLNFTDEKTHTGYVELPGDKLPIDDKRYFTLQTLKSIKVFCLDGEPGRRSDEDETFFLTRALNPKNQVVSIQVSKSTRFPAGDEIKDYDVIILTNVSALGSDEVQRLRNFVKSGGGLIVALGDNVVPATYTKIFNSGAEALLPCNLVEAVGDESNHEQFNVIAVVKYEHPLFAPFKNPNHGDFGTARFYKRFHVAALAGANELLKYDDGTPALIEKQYGRGRVLLFTSTFDTEWTDFPQRGVFLPFIHEMVKYLTLKTSEEKKDYLVNDPAQLSGFDFAPGTTVARKPKASVSVAN